MIKWTVGYTGDVIKYDIVSRTKDVKAQEYALCRVPGSPFKIAIFKVVENNPKEGDIVICVSKEEAEYRRDSWSPPKKSSPIYKEKEFIILAAIALSVFILAVHLYVKGTL